MMLNSKLEVDELSGKLGGDSLWRTTEAGRCAVVAFRCVGSSTERGRSEAVVERESPPERPFLPIHDISVPCSGRLQPEHFLKAFEAGADIVLVVTCRDGDCRYLEGRRRVQQRIDYVRGLLDEVGLGGERLVLLESRAGSSGRHGARPSNPT